MYVEVRYSKDFEKVMMKKKGRPVVAERPNLTTFKRGRE
jgi:hypothetical protein